MKKILLSAAFVAFCIMGANAQRMTDKLNRGLVAVKTDKGVFCSWRITAEEYYDVKYNIYRDGVKLNAEPVGETRYTDATATDGEHSYVVTVVYDKGESAASNIVTLSVLSGISSVSVETVDNAPAYNLAGQKVNDSFKGIVVKNGKKVVVK